MKKRLISLLAAMVIFCGIFAVTASASLAFTDVKTTDWFYADVENAVSGGLIVGKTATTYAPNDNLTYAEAVKLAACIHKKASTGSTEFAIGKPWYTEYVGYAKANGIISKDYDWNKPATRADFMDIFSRAIPSNPGYGFTALEPINNVPDGKIPDVAMTHPQADAIYRLYRAGIVMGSTVNGVEYACRPSTNIRRSEVAAILTRMSDGSARKKFSLAGAGDGLTMTADITDKYLTKQADTFEFTVGVKGGSGKYTFEWYVSFDSLSICLKKNVTEKNSDSLVYSIDKTYFNEYKEIEIYCVIYTESGARITSSVASVIPQ